MMAAKAKEKRRGRKGRSIPTGLTGVSGGSGPVGDKESLLVLLIGEEIGVIQGQCRAAPTAAPSLPASPRCLPISSPP